jgi:beta-lactamase regulating signal transducer with metallopeptidase domain
VAEQIAPAIYFAAVHMLFASAVALAALALCAMLRASATVKYWIWVATTANFVLPAGALVDGLFAAHLASAKPLDGIGDAVADFSRSPLALAVFLVWLAGALAMLALLHVRLRSARSDAGSAAPARRPETPGREARGVPVAYLPGAEFPRVEGILRPRIVLPAGIERLLTRRELEAVLAHEVAHARRRDNLIELAYQAGRCLLWFHPLMWVAGARLSLYRELSCDESVVRGAGGADLVSAIGKLALPARRGPFQASMSSFLRERLERLGEPAARNAASGLAAIAFIAILAAGLFETISHTACCFRAAAVPEARR